VVAALDTALVLRSIREPARSDIDGVPHTLTHATP